MHKIADIAMGVLLIAGIFVMVRPGSQGPAFVTSLTNGFSGVVSSATGGGSFNK